MFSDISRGFLVLTLGAIFLLCGGQVIFAQTKSLETQNIKCIPGKRPTDTKIVEKCWLGNGTGGNINAIAEDGKNKDTDNLVEVGLDGKMKICSTPIPLDINCKPRWIGTVTYCDSLSGVRDCRSLSKEDAAGKKMGDTLGDFAKNSLNPDLQREISARTVDAMTHKMLEDVKTGVRTFNDPYCVLAPCEPYEEAPIGGARRVTISNEEAKRITNDPAFSANLQAWAQDMYDSGKPVLPILPAPPPTQTLSDDLIHSYMTDLGSEVRVYRSSPDNGEQPGIQSSPMPNYFGTGANLPAPSGDSTFRPPSVPAVPTPPTNPWASYFQQLNPASWMTSASQKLKGWLGI